MEIQADQSIRIVSENNLQAMCRYISTMCHRYAADVTRRYAHVAYNNPDEYGNERYMVAMLPVLPNFWGKGDHGVVLSVHKVVHDNHDGEGWQAFTPLLDCPELFRSPGDGQWRTREQIESEAS